MLAIIGGSGLAKLGNLKGTRRKEARTPYGEPSAALTFGEIAGRGVLFLARHGDGHTLAPHEVNYRANVWALKEAGAGEIVSVATVGGIAPHAGPGALLVPDQIIDYTWGRASTYFQGPGVPVKHVDFTEPYSRPLRERLLAAARACGEAAHDGAVYATTQGPRLETAAEIERLARELDLPYAAIAVVANHAAGRGDSRTAISLEAITVVLDEAMERVGRILEQVCKS